MEPSDVLKHCKDVSDTQPHEDPLKCLLLVARAVFDSLILQIILHSHIICFQESMTSRYNKHEKEALAVLKIYVSESASEESGEVRT